MSKKVNVGFEVERLSIVVVSVLQFASILADFYGIYATGQCLNGGHGIVGGFLPELREIYSV